MCTACNTYTVEQRHFFKSLYPLPEFGTRAVTFLVGKNYRRVMRWSGWRSGETSTDNPSVWGSLIERWTNNQPQVWWCTILLENKTTCSCCKCEQIKLSSVSWQFLDMSIASVKKEDPIKRCNRPHRTLSFGLSQMWPTVAWGCSGPHVLQFCLFTFHETWNVASSKNMIFLRVRCLPWVPHALAPKHSGQPHTEPKINQQSCK
jgi:hypothetical protein